MNDKMNEVVNKDCPSFFLIHGFSLSLLGAQTYPSHRPDCQEDKFLPQGEQVLWRSFILIGKWIHSLPGWDSWVSAALP